MFSRGIACIVPMVLILGRLMMKETFPIVPKLLEIFLLNEGYIQKMQGQLLNLVRAMINQLRKMNNSWIVGYFLTYQDAYNHVGKNLKRTADFP